MGVSVRITNEDDPGVVSLAPPTSPQVGHQLRAQLRDPDGGVTGAVWQWQTRQPGPGGRAHQRVASDTTYRPVSGDAGLLLSARVYYADAHGSGKVAAREYAELVAPRRLTVTFGRSSYEAVEGGESVAVTVSLSAAAERLVKIPITRAPESGDYTATWPGVEDTLSFSGSHDLSVVFDHGDSGCRPGRRVGGVGIRGSAGEGEHGHARNRYGEAG